MSKISNTEPINIKIIARMAGALYITLALLGAFGLIYVPAELIIDGDINQTASNIIANELLFRAGIAVSILVQLVNLIVVLFLYKLLKPVNKAIAQMMVGLIMLAVPIAMLSEVFNGAALLTLSDTPQQLSQLALFLDLHEYGINIAQIFWGLWLLPMGYLIFRSGFLPKVLGALLMIGCFGYFVDSFIFFINPDFGIEFSAFLFAGEITLPVWLIWKGVDIKKWNRLSIESMGR